MAPTDELRITLRAYLGESIPEGGSDADTRFSDAAIDRLLEESDSIEAAACQGWQEKAAYVFEENKGVLEKRVGSESLKLVSPKDKRDHALEMAAYYCGIASTRSGGGSRLLGFEPPPEISAVIPPTRTDLSRLIGHYEIE